jgi:FixJ family two-component response regulator
MVVRAMQSGAVDFLQKPFNSQQFLDRVNTALKRDVEAREKRDSRRQLAQGLAMLTPREREILELVLCGESSKCIASALEISPKTVEAHRAHITKKLNVRSFNEIMGKIFGKMISDALHAIQ